MINDHVNQEMKYTNRGVLFSALICWTLTFIMNTYECRVLSMGISLLWFIMAFLRLGRLAVHKELTQHDIIKQAQNIIDDQS